MPSKRKILKYFKISPGQAGYKEVNETLVRLDLSFLKKEQSQPDYIKCKIDECEKAAKNKGLCNKHWRLQQYGKCSIQNCTTYANDHKGLCGWHRKEKNLGYCINHPKAVAMSHKGLCSDCNRAEKEGRLVKRVEGVKYNNEIERYCAHCKRVLNIKEHFYKNAKGYCKLCCKLRCHHLSYENYLNLLDKQNNRCANPYCNVVISDPLRLHIDHDHKCCNFNITKSCGNCIRGLLCVNCNHIAGIVESDDFDKTFLWLKENYL